LSPEGISFIWSNVASRDFRLKRIRFSQRPLVFTESNTE
jgi:hypothetical protein